MDKGQRLNLNPNLTQTIKQKYKSQAYHMPSTRNEELDYPFFSIASTLYKYAWNSATGLFAKSLSPRGCIHLAVCIFCYSPPLIFFSPFAGAGGGGTPLACSRSQARGQTRARAATPPASVTELDP